MNDAPDATQSRAALVHAARRLAAALGARPQAGGAEAPIRAFERAVLTYVAVFRAGRARGELPGMVASRVRSALRTDDAGGYPEPVIAVVVDIAGRAVDEALGE